MDYEKKYNEALKWMRELYPRFPGTFKEEIEHYFPELRESEDEQSYKKIEQLIRLNTSGAEKTSLLAYLENQKEHKHAPDDLQKSFEAGQTSIVDNPEQYGLCKKTEWSEEDERIANALILELKTNPSVATTNGYKRTDYIDWINNLRPSWKPSEEHLSALLAVFNDPNNIGSQTCQLALTDLYEQLKKLGVKEEPEYYQHFDPDC